MFSQMHESGAFSTLQVGIKPSNASAGSVNGTGIDCVPQGSNSYKSCSLLLACGDATGSPSAQSVDAKIQDSADNSTFADVTGGAVTQLVADDGEAEVDVDLVGLERYIRVVTTVAFTGGSSPAIPIATAVRLGGARVQPQ